MIFELSSFEPPSLHHHICRGFQIINSLYGTAKISFQQDEL